MIWKKKLIIILGISLILVSACGTDNTSKDIHDNKGNDDKIEDLTPVEGGQILIPLTNFNTLNPLMTTNSNYYFFSKLMFESLFDFNQDLSIEPKLAESYFIFNEGKTISVKLRSNIRWHDVLH